VRGSVAAGALAAVSLGIAGAPPAQDAASRRSPPVTARVAAPEGSAVRFFLAQGDALLAERKSGDRVSQHVAGFEKVTCAALAASGSRLAVGGGVAGRSGGVAIREESGKLVDAKGEKAPFADLVNAVCWADDDSMVFAASADKTVRGFDPKDLEPKLELKGHTGAVLSLASRGELVVSGSYDRTIRVWNRTSGELLRNLTQHSGPVNALVFEPKGSRFLSASDDRTVRLWDASTGRLFRIVRGHDAPVLSLAWSGSGVFSGGADGVVRELDLENGEVKRKLEPVDPNDRGGAWIYSLTPLPGGEVLADTDRGPRRFAAPR
jgi:WD40 domain-containing protein